MQGAARSCFFPVAAIITRNISKRWKNGIALDGA